MIRFALLKLGWYFFGMARTKLGCSVKWYSLMGLYFKCDTGKMVGLIFKCTRAHKYTYIYICIWIVRGPFLTSRLYVYISICIWIYAYKYHFYMRDACDTSFDTFLYVGVYASCISIPHESILAFSPPVVLTINSVVWIIVTVLQASGPSWGLWQADGRLAGMLEDRTWWNLWVFPKQRKTFKKAGINVWPKSVLLHSQLMKLLSVVNKVDVALAI